MVSGMSDRNRFNQKLVEFLAASPTPFHAVEQMTHWLDRHGFTRLHEADAWQLTAGQRYYVLRNGGSVIAFQLGDKPVVEAGVRMVGAHTDSPCLKVKPQPEITSQGYFQLGVEVYGGALLNPWFDRDLSLAGRVNYLCSQGKIHQTLVDWLRPIAVIPSLAIHLDREVNTNRSINPQRHIVPLLCTQAAQASGDFRAWILQYLQETQAVDDIARVLDFELSFYDTQPPGLVGLHEEFIAGARLDNLLSCYAGLCSLVDGQGSCTSLLVCNDHEEVGSSSASGAQGPFLAAVLRRIAGDEESYTRAMDKSMLISVDNAHGVHPNYADRHDECHGPILNAGPVIKMNANQRYATNSTTAASYRCLCEQAGVPVQTFVVRTDMACGSTIGPITAAQIGVKTLDIGVPTFAMHSIREMAGSEDAYSLFKTLALFYQNEHLL